MKVIQTTDFTNMHNGENIFYSKYEYILQACEDIKSKNHDCVLIVGGSDRCIYNHHLSVLPSNVKKAFFQNCHVDKDLWGNLVVPIPRGIEVSKSIKINEYAWSGSEIEGAEKLELLSNAPIKQSTKFMLGNFRINTNPNHRQIVKHICQSTSHINWIEPPGRTDRERFLSGHQYSDFINNVLDHRAIVCAQGNDLGGNLRMYETLYLSRVAITFNPKMYENLHHLFAVVLVQDLNDLQNYDKMKEQIDEAEKKIPNSIQLLDFNYWKVKILESAN